MKKMLVFLLSFGMASGLFAADNETYKDELWITPQFYDGYATGSAFEPTKAHHDLYSLIEEINEKFNPRGLYVSELKHTGDTLSALNIPSMSIKNFLERKLPANLSPEEKREARIGRITVTLIPEDPITLNIKGD